MNNGIKVMNNDEIRDFCIKKDLKIFELEQQLSVSEYEIEKYKDIVLDLENENNILKSKLSETKADIHYLLENGESIYIRNKYIRGDKDE